MYEQEGFVSVWLGSLPDESSLEDYLRETYDEDGNSSCPFRSDLGVRWLDHDFMEAHFTPKPVRVDQLLKGFSYSESFCGSVLEARRCAGIEEANTAILLYDFAYSSDRPHPHPNLGFIGSFPYTKVVESEYSEGGTARRPGLPE
jgi:hypothetical protein